MTTKRNKPGPGLAVSIVMPAAIPVPSARPAEWLSSIEMRLQLTHDMAADGRIEMPPGADLLLRDAQRWCRLAQTALSRDDEHRVDTAGTAMMALHCAWRVEMAVGAQLRLERAAPLLARQGKNKRLPKTDFYIDMIKKFPELGNDALADHIFNNAPEPDDGVAPFYWDGKYKLIDRKTGAPITDKAMAGQIQRARSQHVNGRKSGSKKTVR